MSGRPTDEWGRHMRMARVAALIGLVLAGWTSQPDLAEAQSLTPNRSGFGSWTRRSVSTPPAIRSTRVTRSGTYRSGGGAAVGAAAGAAIGLIGGIASAMPGENRSDVPSWPPPASCANRYAGSWMVTYAGQTYPVTVRQNGTSTAHCPLCMPSQRWTCRGNVYFLLDPVVITMTLAPNGRSWTSANGSGTRISPGQTQVASVSGASRPGGSPTGPGASAARAATATPQPSMLVEQFAGGRNGSCSDITGTGGGAAPACRRGVTRSAVGQRGANRAGRAMAEAERALQMRGQSQRQAALRQAQRWFVQAAQELNVGGDPDAARVALQDARVLDRALSEPEGTVRLSNGREYTVRNGNPPDVVLREGQPGEYRVTGRGPPDGASVRDQLRCRFAERDHGVNSQEAIECRARLAAQENVCSLGAGCNTTSCGTHLAVVQNQVPRMSENWVRQQMRRVGCAAFYRPRSS